MLTQRNGQVLLRRIDAAWHSRTILEVTLGCNVKVRAARRADAPVIGSKLSSSM